MTSFTRHLVAAATCAALAFPVLAQTTPAAPAAADTTATTLPTKTSQRADRQAKRQQWQEKRTERHAARMGQLKKQLAITPAQEAAWTHFAQAMQPPGNTARPDFKSMEKLTTPERIDRMRELRAQRNTAMDARLDATKAFYTELQPEQQHTFDRISARMMHGGAGHGGRGMHNQKGHGKHAWHRQSADQTKDSTK